MTRPVATFVWSPHPGWVFPESAGPLDALATSSTAFESFAELAAACRRGWAPTLPPTTRRRRLLARVLRGMGHVVYDGRSAY